MWPGPPVCVPRVGIALANHDPVFAAGHERTGTGYKPF
jgi:hypothetical protein